MAEVARRSAFQIIPLNGSDGTIRDYKFRKAHRKVRTGCLACRAKRVKCDESQPICIRCKSNGRLCSYNHKDTPLRELTRWALVSTQPQTGSSSTLHTRSISSSSFENGTPTAYLLQHAHNYWGKIFYFHNDDVKSLLTGNLLIRSTVLAITACHLRHCSPKTLQHRIAEHFQQSMVLEQFQITLNTNSTELGQSGAAAVMLSAALLNILSFALLDSGASKGDISDPRNSWVFSSDESRLGWLTLQTGLHPIYRHVEMYLQYTLSSIGPILVGAGQEYWAAMPLDQSLSDVPKIWIEVFGLDEPGSYNDCDVQCEADVLRLPLLALARLRRVPTTPQNIFKSFLFLGKVQKDFRALLFRRDERAMWIMGYWLGYMSCFKEIWWCERRAVRDYTAIVMYLRSLDVERRPGLEGERWESLMRELESAINPSTFGA